MISAKQDLFTGNKMFKFIKYVTLEEGATKPIKDLTQTPLPYKKDELEPAISEETIRYHYGKLYKGYVDRYNDGEGDPDFNEAGAYLHDKYFTQFCSPKSNNRPTGKSLELIEKRFKSFEEFKEEFEKTALDIQGSGWCYLSVYGDLRTIKNHEIKQGITVILDMWEHAWALDYQADKKSYINNFWKIIDWDIINQRL